MAVLVISEPEPRQSMESIIIRSAYILLPASLLLIKYFPSFGVLYGRWTGELMWVGVSTQKNGLGLLCAISIFFLIWVNLKKWRTGELFKNKSQFIADIFILSLACFLLRGPGGSFSATSVVTLIIGLTLIMILNWNENRIKWVASHMKLLIVVFIILILLAFPIILPIITSTLDRNESLTGRDTIWEKVLIVAYRNPVIGVGFGSYWGLKGDLTEELGVGQAHNGYLDIFLQLGIYGIFLLVLILFSFCNKIKHMAKNNMFDLSALGICFVLMAIVYNISESDFFQPTYLWTILIFLYVLFSTPNIYKNIAFNEPDIFQPVST